MSLFVSININEKSPLNIQLPPIDIRRIHLCIVLYEGGFHTLVCRVQPILNLVVIMSGICWLVVSKLVIGNMKIFQIENIVIEEGEKSLQNNA